MHIKDPFMYSNIRKFHQYIFPENRRVQFKIKAQKKKLRSSSHASREEQGYGPRISLSAFDREGRVSESVSVRIHINLKYWIRFCVPNVKPYLEHLLKFHNNKKLIIEQF